MARTRNQPVEPDISIAFPRYEEKSLASGAFGQGMISTPDPADLPDDALSYAKNARIRYGKVERRPGNVLYTPSKPNSLPIRKLYDYLRGRSSRGIIRVTPTTIHYSSGGVWAELTGSLNSLPYYLIGDAAVHIELVNVLGSLVLANGNQRLLLVDVAAGTFTELSPLAPRARYVTGFFNRAVAASVGNSYPGIVSVYWSGDSNLTEWDAAVDISAGQSPIVESPSDVADPITGIFGLSNVLMLLREQSLWLATKIPTASNPFNFYNAKAGIGCDVPSSAKVLMEGLAFLDMQSRGVWYYVPGTSPQRIGYKVERDIINSIDDPDKIFSAVAGEQHLYLLGIPQADGSAKLWIYNIQEQTWSFDEVEDATAALSVIQLIGYTSYDELASIYAAYDDIDVTYDELTSAPERNLALMLGRSDGDIHVQDEALDQDNGVNYDFEIRSKEYASVRDAMTLSSIEFTIKKL